MRDALLRNASLNSDFEGQRKHIITHSTSAGKLVEILHDSRDDAQKILRDYDQIRLGSTFVKSYLKEKVLGIVSARHAVYKWQYERKHLDKQYGDVWTDVIYAAILQLQGQDAPGRKAESLWNKEILFMTEWAEEVREKILAKPFPVCVQNSQNIEAWHGECDTIASLSGAKEVFQHMNVPLTVFKNTFHYPYTEHRLPAILNHFETASMQPPEPTIAVQPQKWFHNTILSRFLRLAP